MSPSSLMCSVLALSQLSADYADMLLGDLRVIRAVREICVALDL